MDADHNKIQWKSNLVNATKIKFCGWLPLLKLDLKNVYGLGVVIHVNKFLLCCETDSDVIRTLSGDIRKLSLEMVDRIDFHNG